MNAFRLVKPNIKPKRGRRPEWLPSHQSTWNLTFEGPIFLKGPPNVRFHVNILLAGQVPGIFGWGDCRVASRGPTSARGTCRRTPRWRGASCIICPAESGRASAAIPTTRWWWTLRRRSVKFPSCSFLFGRGWKPLSKCARETSRVVSFSLFCFCGGGSL